MARHATSIRPPPHTPKPANRLLASLPAEDFARILPLLETVPMSVKHVVHKRGATLSDVYFPNGGVFSITAMMADGSAIEVATVGDEGMLGSTAFLGGDIMPGETMLQVSDASAERMALADFQSEMDRRGALYDCIGRYSQGMLALIMQSAACIGLHQVHERCCRWLLMTRDRIHSDQFELSHEFLAMMIGATRPTVSIVAAQLQQAGLIQYTHGRMTIVDGARLEAASCECYANMKAEFERLGL